MLRIPPEVAHHQRASGHGQCLRHLAARVYSECQRTAEAGPPLVCESNQPSNHVAWRIQLGVGFAQRGDDPFAASLGRAEADEEHLIFAL